MSSFSGLSTALSALHAQRRVLDVTAQNVANANTDGYTRQRVTLQSVGGPTVPALWSTYRGAGGGVTVSAVERLRDAFLESRGHAEHGRLGQLSGRQVVLASVEQAFGEPGDTGLQSQLSDFWNAWHDVANTPGGNPAGLAARAQLLERAETLADGFRQAGAALDAQWGARHEQLRTTVASVNATAATVAELNEAIGSATRAGMPANELADRRDLLVMELASSVGATVRAGADGSVDVFVGGSALVLGSGSTELAVDGATSLADLQSAAAPPPRVVLAADGFGVDVGGGAGSLVEAAGATIPSYAARLDAIAGELAAGVNGVHTAGKDLDGAAGLALFSGTTAGGLAVAVTDPRRVAAAAADGGAFDGANAARLAKLASSPSGPDTLYRQLVVALGVEAQTANRRVEIQYDVTGQVDAARASVAGVNLDEEMVGLISYQRAYESAARVMTTVDATLDTLVNRTGTVGR